MQDVELYLLDIDRNKTSAIKAAEQTARRLENQELKLISLIESLGQYLNSEETATRVKSISYLADVLAALDPKALSRQQRDLLCDFFLSRVADGVDGLGACARALLALEERGQWEQDTASAIITTFIDHSHPLNQVKLQNERFLVLRLINLLLLKYREAIRKLHDGDRGFMSRFVSYFDGEKDPRNLMIVFSILKVPMTEWNISAHAQELFEAVFNYFPITFRPPPDDPYGISAQQLKNRLCECIAANGAFAPFAFPALLDKLDSTALNTKRDVLGVILACILAYGSLTVSAYAITLWDALKYEVFNAQEDDLAEGALAILKSIATKLSDRRDGLLDSYVLPLAKECNRHFEDTPTKQSQAAAQIVCKVAEASHRTFDLIFRAVVPNIISMYHSSEAIARRRGLLEVLVKLHRSAIEIYGTWTEKPSMNEHVDSTNAGSAENGNALLDFREQLLNIMISVLAGMRTNEVSLCLTCVDGLLQMARLRCFLSVAELTRVMQLMSTVLISEEDSRQSEVKAATLDALVEMAHQKPQTCIDVVIPELMAKLPDTDHDDSASRVPVLEAFAKLGTEEKLFSTVIVRLRGKLFAALQHQASTKYIFAIVSALLYTFTEQVSRPTNHIDYGPYYDSIVKPFMSHVADATRSDHPAFGDDAFWDVLGRLCNVIVRPQQLERQKEVAQELGALWDKATQSQSEEPKLQSELISSRLIIMSTYLIASIRRVVNITIDVGKHVQLLARLAAGSAMSREADTAVLWQISLLLNKFASPANVEKILMDYMGTAFAPETRSESSIRVVFAMTKGAVLRNHPKVVNVFPSLLESLADPDWGSIIARRFSTLLEPDTMLIKENDCLISGLHRQKLYAYVVPAVIESFREAAPATKKNHLIALSGILRWLPYSVIEADLPALIPLLLQSLDLDDEHGVRSATIDCLTTVLLQNPKAVQEHVGSLISRLLTTATTPDTPAKLRATALQCLTLVPGHFRGDIVLPYKRQVVKRLVSALDDRKRAVRMEAVKCTARWVDMDEVDDDE